MVDMSSTLSGLGPMFSSVSSLMMIGVLFLISLILLGVIGGFFYWMMLQRKRYGEFVVEIYGRDALGNPVVIMDNAGVFVNRKTGNKRLYLKKAKISLMLIGFRIFLMVRVVVRSILSLFGLVCRIISLLR